MFENLKQNRSQLYSSKLEVEAKQKKNEKEMKKIIQLLEKRFDEISTQLSISENIKTEINKTIQDISNSTERDFIASRGEYLNAIIMAEYLGYEFIDAKELIFFKENGTLDEEKTYLNIKNKISDNKNVVVPGFYGIDFNGKIKTFERGGSDITGSILAKGIGADLYENWTDVTGVMTGDPKENPDAETIEFLSYEELLNITVNGSQVYHPDAVKHVRDGNIPLNIKNTNEPTADGTLILEKEKTVRTFKIAILGLGTVGKGVEAILRENKSLILNRLKQNKNIDVNYEVIKILDRDEEVFKKFEKGVVTSDISDIINNPEVDIIVELIGGKDIATKFILDALSNKKHVVTANKFAISEAKGLFEDTAIKNDVKFLYEAAVAGTIPVIRALKDSLIANNILKIEGIINGTTNYILSNMTTKNKSYEEALKDAQDLGFAEFDPSSDVDGLDVLHKISILSNIAFGSYPKKENINISKMRDVKIEDIENAKKRGNVIKYIAESFLENDEIKINITLKEVPKESDFGSLDGATNAINIVCDNAKEIFLKGQGAGSRPTASSVVGDIMEIIASS